MGVITERSAQHFSGVDADKASIPGAALDVGDRYFATDTKILYWWDSAAWVLIVPDNTISAAKLQTNSVETLKIKALNVTTGKIALLAITAAQLGALAVETAKINNLAVTNGKLALLSVAAGNLQTDAVETIKIKDANVTRAKLAADALGDFGHKLLHIRDEKASGTGGGTFTLGAWRTRDLNTVLTNEISGSSLASDQITLPAGDYFIMARAPAHHVGFNKVKVRNITDGADILIGSSITAPTDEDYSDSFVTGRFTLAAEKVIEIQHMSSATKALIGFGRENTFGVIELYTDVLLWGVS